MNLKNKIYKKLFTYPSLDMLHNALYFISIGEYNDAYEEICYALQKADIELRKEEAENFSKIQRERRNKDGE